ncbi:helix-turn-helix domain-containing protein [Luedemannella helvata]|uniref:Helix-turn-helix domain-containing protein n=1 Tax=Luedemannella helvata TaxID=349315 RepID=A0ABP4X089_9ACTN
MEILGLIRAEHGLTAADIAARTGLHLNTVRAHLDRLVEAGILVKARASAGQPGRPAWRYRAIADDPAPAPYRALAAALIEHLASAGDEAPAVAARAGESWGRDLAAAVAPTAPVDTALAVLDGLGFDPARQPDDTETVVHLRRCPFLDLVGKQPDVMCGLHAGVVRGALRAAGAPDATVILEPFGAPTACVVRMLGAEPSAPGAEPSAPGAQPPDSGAQPPDSGAKPPASGAQP